MKPETILSRAIQEALKDLPGCHFERVHAGIVPVKRGYLHCASKGTSDLIGVVRGGRFVGLEIKTDEGKTTSEQDEWAACVRELGGAYFVVRSVEEAVTAVQSVMR